MMKDEVILNKVYRLLELYRTGVLGGEKMPEHENPGLEKTSRENYMYFTLPMALNYQRNSYVLWECANRMYREENGKLFESKYAAGADEEELREILVRYRVALQPNKQPQIWKRLCVTIEEKLQGDIRNLFLMNECSVKRIKGYISGNKKDFPYLSGNKICNYWLYVMEQYTDCCFTDRENITVAPDTHVIQASAKLGVISKEECSRSDVQNIVAARWRELLEGTELVPIDIHTPMWLWSRGKFEIEV